MSRRLRIGFGRIAQETNSYSQVPTVRADFERFHWLEGAELMACCEPGGVEAEGFKANAELSGFVRGARGVGGGRVELVPLVSAWAIPGGPLTEECLQALIDALVESIRAAGPLDGLMLSMHGAMGAEGTHDPEADVIDAVRAELGRAIPIAVTLDLHAQVGRRFVEATDIVAAYRTNPHRDHAEVGFRAGQLLVQTLLRRVRPTVAWRSLPLVLGGGVSIDFLSPMRPIYRWMRQMERDPRVLYLSLFNAHMWNDSPDLGWASHVITDGDPELAERLAEELAEKLWSVRHLQPPAFPDPSEAIEKARGAWLRRRVGTICMSDASDVVGAGAPGESTQLVRALLEQGKGLLSYAPIRAPSVAAALWDRPIGAGVDVEVGGRLEPEIEGPLRIRGRMLGRKHFDAIGRAVLVDLDHVKLVITEGPAMAMKPDFYTGLGLSPWRADIVVVKSFFPFRWYFLPHNRMTLYVKTRGVTDWDVGLRTNFRLPVHPRDAVDDWRPADRARRGVD